MRQLTRCAIAIAVGAGALANAGPWDGTDPTYPRADVRAVGMAGSFVAVADGPTALVWNPAGLVGHPFPAANIGLRLNPFDTFYLTFANPISTVSTLGWGWARHTIGGDDPDQPRALDRLSIGVGTQLEDRVSYGVSVSYLNPEFQVAADSTAEGVGLTIDTGAMLDVTDRLRVAVAVYDLANAKVWRSGGRIERLSKRTVRVGVAYRPSSSFVASAQVDRGVRVGAEAFPLTNFGLRFGVGYTKGSWTVGFGASHRIDLLRTEYSMGGAGAGRHTHDVALSFALPRGHGAAQISQLRIRPLFASLSKAYTLQPVATAIVSNPTSTPLTARVELSFPDHAPVPSIAEVNLRPYARKRVYLRTMLSEAAVASNDDQPVMGTVSLVNPNTGVVFRRESVRTFLYRRGAITWDDVRKAAAFVTPADPSVRHFVRESLRPYRAELEMLPDGMDLVTRAMVLFEATATHAVTYQVDPNTPYAEVHSEITAFGEPDAADSLAADMIAAAFGPTFAPARSARPSGGGIRSVLDFIALPYTALVGPGDPQLAVDDVQYPAELLRSRSGDCDDTTVLLCALLECAGVSTAFVESPEHLFMMFDTGLPVSEDSYVLPCPREMFVELDGTYWVPLETTMLREGFMQAWRHASEVVAEGDGSVATTTMRTAWSSYAPADFLATGYEPPSVPDIDSVRTRVEARRADLAGLLRQSPIGRGLLAPLAARPDDHGLRSQAVFWLLNAGLISEAHQHLAVLEVAKYNPPRTLALRAVYWFQQRDIGAAEACARQALSMAPWVPELQDLVQQISIARKMNGPR